MRLAHLSFPPRQKKGWHGPRINFNDVFEEWTACWPSGRVGWYFNQKEPDKLYLRDDWEHGRKPQHNGGNTAKTYYNHSWPFVELPKFVRPLWLPQFDPVSLTEVQVAPNFCTVLITLPPEVFDPVFHTLELANGYLSAGKALINERGQLVPTMELLNGTRTTRSSSVRRQRGTAPTYLPAGTDLHLDAGSEGQSDSGTEPDSHH